MYELFKFGAKTFYFPKYNKHFQSVFFSIFGATEVIFLEI